MTAAIERLPPLPGAVGTPPPGAPPSLTEQTCDSTLEGGECFFCTGPETD